MPTSHGGAEKRRQGIDAIADPRLLKKIWKKYLRYDLQNPRLQSFELGHDALESLPLDWDLDALVQEIADELRAGTYRAQAPEVVRAAKGAGLTRPLAFLAAEDVIVYKTIVQVARSSLREHSVPWTSFGRNDPPESTKRADEYSWFVLWLQQDKRRWEIIQSHPLIVITDIANFFPYVPVSGVATHVLNHSNLDEPVVHLLVRILEDFAQMHLYRRTPSVGLPQEGFDCSRVLAHTYLAPLDEAFAPEGKDGRYTRHVDDIVIGVRTRDEGLRAISRAQMALEGLGLYPNATKTEILSTAHIDREWFRDTNDYLGDVEERLERREEVDVSEFEELLKHHFETEQRGRNWSQVLKRFITVSRWVRSSFLGSFWQEVIESAPEAARHTFDYLSTYPLTVERFQEIRSFTHRQWGLYEDIDLLLHEFVCAAPNDDDPELRRAVGEWAIRIVRQQYYESSRRSASAALSVGKFGTQDDILRLVPLLDQKPQIDHPARRQIAVILAGVRHFTPDQLLQMLPNPGRTASRHLRFLRALQSGDERAAKMALNLMKPARRKKPERHMFRVRCLFLAPLVAQGSSLLLVGKRAAWKATVNGMPSAYRDRAGERWLGLD